MADAPSPALRSVKAVVVRSGETNKGAWITETRNVREDYKRLFGEEAEKVVGVRIQINSQHTKSQAESFWRSVTFKAAP
jgi:Fe-S cluster assembly scaffold protein SufB